MAIIMDGSELAKKTRIALKKKIQTMSVQPGLGVILVGDDPASAIYVRNKERACEKAGLFSKALKLPQESTTEDVLAAVESMNKDPEIHAFIVQLPLPKQVDKEKVLAAVLPEKDADGLTEENVLRTVMNREGVLPCTPRGCIELLKEYNVPLMGAHAVVIGRSDIVGKPAARLLLQENCTVTVCHSRTKEIAAICKTADIIVAAIGKPRFVTKDMVKPGAAIIDVGINRLEDGTVCGDVDFAEVSEIAGYITPVPGGVGPMTIAMLLKNTVEICEKGLQNT